MTALLTDSQENLPFAGLHSSQLSFPHLSLMVGIAVCNEEQNIGKLIENLLDFAPSEITSIVVVSSDSTDKTDEIVEGFCQQDPRVQLVIEKERNGKASALNLLLEHSENYDYMVYMGGDNLPDQEALAHLLDTIKSENVDIIGARPIPVDDPETFMGFCTHLLWNLHHESSLEVPKISGELMVFKSRIIRELPPAIINDDAYIQSLGEMRKCKIAYCPQAEVLLKGPSTIDDFLKQRKRVFIGHKQLEFLVGRKVSTMKMPKWRQIMKACPFRGFKGRSYVVGFILLQGLAFVYAKWDFARHKLPFKWQLVKTTKNLQNVDALLLAKIEP